MVSFELTDEQKEMQRRAHEFAVKEIRPNAAYYDRTGEFPYEIVKKGIEQGLAGLPYISAMMSDDSGINGFIIAEELYWGCAGIALAMQGSNLAAGAIAATATPEQLGRLMMLCFGTADDPKFGALAVTEPNAGSDVAGISTTAKKDGDYYILNGVKQFITNGGVADVTVVFATLDKSLGHRGIVGFAVEKGTPGLIVGKKENKMGIRASNTATVILDNCRVPAKNLLGGEEKALAKLEKARQGQGSRSQGAMATFELSRPYIGAMAIGVARASFEYALDYAKRTIVNGRPLIEDQSVGFTLADMCMQIETSRLMTWRAGWMARNRKPFNMGEGSMAKAWAADMAMDVTIKAIQICGEEGASQDCPLEKWMRDAKIFQIFEGTSQIQRLVIARALANL